MKNFLSLFIIMWIVPLLAMAELSEIPLSEDNCNLTNPPKESGEWALHGFPMKIYPRRSTMGKNYHGCQTLWIENDNKVIMMLVYYFKDGKLQLSKERAKDDPSKNIICQYIDNKLITKNQDCRDVEQRISRGLGPPKASKPAGCLQKSKQAYLKGQLPSLECGID